MDTSSSPPTQPMTSRSSVSPEGQAHEYEDVLDLNTARITNIHTNPSSEVAITHISPPAGATGMEYSFTQCPAYAAMEQVTDV